MSIVTKKLCKELLPRLASCNLGPYIHNTAFAAVTKPLEAKKLYSCAETLRIEITEEDPKDEKSIIKGPDDAVDCGFTNFSQKS